MVLIWKLKNIMKNSELQNSTADNRCCPSKPRQWGKGNQAHDSNLPTRKKREIQSQFYDPRTSKFQNVDVDGILKLKHDLQGINSHIPFAAMLQDNK